MREVEDSVQSSARFGRKTVLIPDAVICLESAVTKARGLFFLEVDMGSEKLISEDRAKFSLVKKMLLYQDYRVSKGYERFSDMFGFNFKGFRVLTVMKEEGRPLKAGEIADIMDAEKKDVDKAMNSLKKQGAISSPKRCFWEPSD